MAKILWRAEPHLRNIGEGGGGGGGAPSSPSSPPPPLPTYATVGFVKFSGSLVASRQIRLLLSCQANTLLYHLLAPGPYWWTLGVLPH